MSREQLTYKTLLLELFKGESWKAYTIDSLFKQCQRLEKLGAEPVEVLNIVANIVSIVKGEYGE